MKKRNWRKASYDPSPCPRCDGHGNLPPMSRYVPYIEEFGTRPMARAAGVSPNYINLLKFGRRVCNWKMVDRLDAAALALREARKNPDDNKREGGKGI